MLIKKIYDSQIKYDFLFKILNYSTSNFSFLKQINHVNEYNNIKSKDLFSTRIITLNKPVVNNINNLVYAKKPFIKFNYSIYHQKNKKIKEKRNYYLNLMAFAGINGLMFYTLYKYNQKEINEVTNLSYAFLKKYYFSLKNFIELPYNSYVLLDKLELINEPKEKTLVLNLDKTLVCYKYSLFDGFKIIQRPGLKHFINELSDYYEIILFSNEDQSLIEYVSNLIDKNNNKIRYRLGNDCIKYINGIPIKDLEYLNRNKNDTIVIDFDLNNISNKYKNNAIILPSFNGDGKDRELFFIIPFLKIISNKSNDIRSYIMKYGNYRTYENYYKQNMDNPNIIIRH